MTYAVLASEKATATPRSIGTLKLVTKAVAAGSSIDRFRTSGSLKVAFPRCAGAVEGIMVNTSGGLTGEDRFETTATAGAGSHLILTTQAAERAYRSQAGTARVTTHLTAEQGATLHWLPQEFIVFDGGAVKRRLTVDLDLSAELVLVEPIVFGRRAMREMKISGRLQDTITLRRQNTTIFHDRIDLADDITATLQKSAVASDMTAMASALYYGPRAEALLQAVRRVLPETGGASLLPTGLLTLRLLATDSFLLRRSLVPVLEQLTGRSLPKSWSL